MSTSGSTAALESTDGSSTDPVPPPETTTGPTTDPSTGAVSASSTGDEAMDTTSGDSTGPEPMGARSCAELLAMDPSVETGVHTLVDLDGDEFEAFCLMEFDGGGWTLVGRSSAGAASTPFGWRSQRGSIEDTSDAYSLDASSRGLQFTQLLLANRTGDQSVPDGRAYMLGVAAGLVESHEDTPVATAFAGTVLGDCTPTNPPQMLDYAGYTGRDDAFFFRDMMGASGFGLRASGWGLAHDDCWRGAALNGDQGLLFVR